jgi:hypothetical protein
MVLMNGENGVREEVTLAEVGDARGSVRSRAARADLGCGRPRVVRRASVARSPSHTRHPERGVLDAGDHPAAPSSSGRRGTPDHVV